MNLIEIEDKFYILATSSFADDRTMVLKQGDTFGVFDRFGDIQPIGQKVQGIYNEGTRFISKLELQINNKRPLLLSSALNENNNMLLVDLTNADYPDETGKIIEKGTLHILRSIFLWKNVCYEKLRISNYGFRALPCHIDLSFGGDFADIFEVRGMKRKKRGQLITTDPDSQRITLGYLGLDEVKRFSDISFSPIPDVLKSNKAEFHKELNPKEVFEITLSTGFKKDGKEIAFNKYNNAQAESNEYLKEAKLYSSDIFTSNDQFNNWLNRSGADLFTMVTQTESGPYPYAGVPWYSVPFGRDGIITAFECLWINPEIAKGVLLYLAKTQATEMDPFRDAEPGKILHEKRAGEMAELNEIPFKQYYGTIDATPLYIVLAGEYYRRTADLDTIKKIWPNIKLALEWIDKYGDIDGDGFVEYARKTESGLINQGWKDSFDSISHENGNLAEAPIALCEVQGYVYQAKKEASILTAELGHREHSAKLLTEAKKLKKKFNEAFWSEDKQTFYLALDANKKPCNIKTSNAGHCLFSNIASSKHAEGVVQSLLSEEMFSGWGIRTLATDEIQFNPMSYHNGSVWPHDNAMIAYGMALYGYREEVHKVLAGLFDASLFLELQRLPELFCGFDRRPGQAPTQYPVACSPQAWSVAAAFLFVQSFLGLEIIAKENLIRFYKPMLPGFIDNIIIRNLRLNEETALLQIRKQGGSTEVILLNKECTLKIEVIQ
jgi:glycogen debranching enzyme